MGSWSLNPPAEPGWYWWRYLIDFQDKQSLGPAQVIDVHVFRGKLSAHGAPIEERRGAWWSEPIKKPRTVPLSKIIAQAQAPTNNPTHTGATD